MGFMGLNFNEKQFNVEKISKGKRINMLKEIKNINKLKFFIKR